MLLDLKSKVLVDLRGSNSKTDKMKKSINSVFNFKRILNACGYSCKDIASAYQSEAAIRQEMIAIAALSFILCFCSERNVSLFVVYNLS